MMLQILQEWLEGRGLPVTWEALVKTFKDTGTQDTSRQDTEH